MTSELQTGRIGYDESGHGTALVFIHGFPLDRTLWAQQRVALASRARCIAIDLPGFGESDVIAGATMSSYAAAVMSLLDQLGIERAALCGMSMGGYVAMACWREYADRVAGLVLCDTRATPDSDEQKLKRDEGVALVQSAGVAALAATQIPGLIGKRSRGSNPMLVEWMTQMMERQSAAGVIAALGAMRERPDSIPLLATVTVPTLIVVGDEDVLTPVSDSRRMLEALPTAAHGRLDIIAGAGHASCVERPATVTRSISDFLETWFS